MRINGKPFSNRNPAFVIREAEIVLMFRDGFTLQQIGDKYGITRERVRQILARLGLDSFDGGFTVRRIRSANEKACLRKEVEARKEARHLKTWGISRQEMAEITERAGVPKYNSRHPAMIYRSQRGNAGARGIKWELKFSQWWEIWQKSGKWELRGRERGRYVMARWADDGPYSVENVYICTTTENIKDGYITKPAAERALKAKKTRESKAMAIHGGSQ